MARISETGAHRAKISSTSTPWGRKRVLYVQLLELLLMAKLVLNRASMPMGLLFIYASIGTMHIGMYQKVKLTDLSARGIGIS